MIARCKRRTHASYANYGGRGICVCERWLRYENFLADMGRRPSSQHSLDRIDVDGNYMPSNCRWATKKEQRANQRARKRVDQFTNTELISELLNRGYPNPLRVPQHHGAQEGRTGTELLAAVARGMPLKRAYEINIALPSREKVFPPDLDAASKSSAAASRPARSPRSPDGATSRSPGT
jgi:hypothetical protein